MIWHQIQASKRDGIDLHVVFLDIDNAVGSLLPKLPLDFVWLLQNPGGPSQYASRPTSRTCNYADEPSGGFIIETPIKEGVHLMTLMKSLAPLATHPLDVLSCPQFLEVPAVPKYGMQSCASLAQGGQRPCHAESIAFWILTSHPVYLELHLLILLAC